MDFFTLPVALRNPSRRRTGTAGTFNQTPRFPWSSGRCCDHIGRVAADAYAFAKRAAIILFAADHGIAAQGVSAFPSAVTVEMLRNFARGGAAISVMAKALDVPLTVVDVGTLADTPVDGVVSDKCRRGTDDFSTKSAMTTSDLAFALSAGQRAVATTGTPDIVLFGEMGIGNTSAAAAIAASLIGVEARSVVGAGTGLNTTDQEKKARIIEQALARHELSATSTPLEVLTHVGGLEIAALTGGMIAAAQAGIPVLVDGFIVSVAALAAVRINPSVRDWFLFSHRSQEQGHARVLDALVATPC